MRAHAYRHQRCSRCGRTLDSPLDLVVYNREGGVITELEFRHHGPCDDRRFSYSRHVQAGFDDLMESWEASPYFFAEAADPADGKDGHGKSTTPWVERPAR